MADLPSITAAAWAIACAVGAASLALLAKVVEAWITAARISARERKAVAAALAGEIGGYLDALKPGELVLNLRRLAEKPPEDRTPALLMLPPLPSGHPVYDRLADKAGLLPPEITQQISRFYNVVRA